MAGSGPSVLVVAGDPGERTRITALLRESGFAPVPTAEERDALMALRREPVAAAVVALPGTQGIELLRAARCCQPGLAALLVMGPGAMPDDEERAAIVERPFESRRLLGRLIELILSETAGHSAPQEHRRAAEYGIAAAKLACLYRRQATAAASGMPRLAHDLTRQIGETWAVHRMLAAALPVGWPAGDPLPGIP